VRSIALTYRSRAARKHRRGELGVEPIYRMLAAAAVATAPCTYYAAILGAQND
jgi:hypothetical protein